MLRGKLCSKFIYSEFDYNYVMGFNRFHIIFSEILVFGFDLFQPLSVGLAYNVTYYNLADQNDFFPLHAIL